MAAAAPVINATVAADALISYARERAAKLLVLAERPEMCATPASIAKLEDVESMLQEAHIELEDFARMNGFKLS